MCYVAHRRTIRRYTADMVPALDPVIPLQLGLLLLRHEVCVVVSISLFRRRTNSKLNILVSGLQNIILVQNLWYCRCKLPHEKKTGKILTKTHTLEKLTDC
jgi:hypothetical protein